MIVEETTPKVALMSRNETNNRKKIEEVEEELRALEQPQEEQEEKAQEPEDKSDLSDNNLSAEEKSFKKRYGDLRRYQQQKEKEFKQQIEALEKKIEEARSTPTKLPKTEEEVKTWIRKYPDVAAIVESIADQRAQEKASQLDLRLKEIEERDSKFAFEKALADIRKKHPDFDEINGTDEFHSWVEEQPDWIQTALYDSLDVKAASRAIDLYKLDKGMVSKKVSNKEAAIAVNTRNRVAPQTEDQPTWSESRVKKLSMQQYEKHEDEILEAMRTGKFVYDLSGAAR